MLGEHDDVLALFTNHPKNGDVPSFNAALCGLWAAGLGYAADRTPPAAPEPSRRCHQRSSRRAPSTSTPADGKHA